MIENGRIKTPRGLLRDLAEPSEQEKAREEKIADLFSRLSGFTKVRIHRVGRVGDSSGLKPGERAACGSIDLTEDVIDNFEETLIERLGGGHYYLSFFKGGKFQEECVFDIDPAMFPPVDHRKKDAPPAMPTQGASIGEVMALVQSQTQQMMDRMGAMLERAMHQQQPRREDGEVLKAFISMQERALQQSERSNERMLALIQAASGHAPAVAVPAVQPLEQLRAVGELVRAVDDIRGEREPTPPASTADRLLDAIAKPAGERLVQAFFPSPTPSSAPAPILPTPPAAPKDVRIPHEARVATPDEIARMKANRPPPGSSSRPATEVPPAPTTTELRPDPKLVVTADSKATA